MLLRLLVPACALLVATPALAAPLNPWGSTPGAGVFALTPYLLVYQDPDIHPYVYGQYGLTDRVDLMAGVGATTLQGFAVDDVELMPRFFLNDQNAVALHAKWAPGDTDVVVAPEWHGVFSAGSFTFTGNVGWGPTVGEHGFGAGTVYAIVAPEVFVTEATSVFVELDPTYDTAPTTDPFSLVVLPGVSSNIAEKHYFCVGVGIPVVPFDARGIFAEAWYSIAFGG
jgi:hypothetical protein